MTPTPSTPDRVDVVIVGAGMAGLACALRLSSAASERGLSVAVLERDTRVGGRVGTDLVDGFRCDRGFQLLNPAYPEARRVLDLTSLALQPFPAAIVVGTDDGPRVLGDPRRMPPRLVPRAMKDSLTALGTLREKAAFARWALGCARRDADDLLSAPDQPWGRAMDGLGIDGELRRAVLEPFLAGTLAETDGSTSRRFVELLIRSFVRGRPSVPWQGMQAIGDQLAAALPDGVVHLGARVSEVSGTTVGTEDGPLTARAVVVASDPATAALLTGTPEVATKALTTFWHAVPGGHRDPGAVGPFGASAAIHVDGERRSPLANTVVLSAAARAYSPDDRALVASTILGPPSADPGQPTSEAGVRHEAARVYGTDTSGWELVHVHEIPNALTSMPPPLDVRRPVALGDGLFVAGDHRDSASIQGALVSGRRAADAVLGHLGIPVPPRPPLDTVHGRRRPVTSTTLATAGGAPGSGDAR